MKIHFIAIGGSVMHNLAIALTLKGWDVSGSDDEFFEPSRSRLNNYGLLPEHEGWDPGRVTADMDAVVIGMHAREDNPELLRARDLGLKIYSFPEFIYNQARNKKRIVIGGSHGKTTITSMIMHVLRKAGIDFDYLVGANVEGFDVMVKMTEKARVMVIEGDEYLTSAMDPRPKFHLYLPGIAVISGIAWDHFNVFPTVSGYTDQFRIFADKIEKNGILIYNTKDPAVSEISKNARKDIRKIPYGPVDYTIERETCYMLLNGKKYRLNIFGVHNMENLSAAMNVCRELGIDDQHFAKHITSFRGASRRMQKIAESTTSSVFWDFAHSPSKLQATIRALKAQYPKRTLIACMELHTYSSLSKAFLPNYKNSMQDADEAMVYYNPHAVALKGLEMPDRSFIKRSFGQKNLKVIIRSSEMQEVLESMNMINANLLLMSSGSFDGLKIRDLAEKLINK